MKKVCVVGLGFVGCAMATAIASSKNDKKPIYQVIGIDLDNDQGREKVNLINRGVFPLNTDDENLLSSFKKVKVQGNLTATTDKSIYADMDIIVVDIQLDIDYLNDEPQLEFSQFKIAINEIGFLAKPGALIIIETTVPPGTCEKIIVPLLQKELAKRDLPLDSFLVAHSYERVMPGSDYLASITDYWRVFSGYNAKSGDACESFLKNVINVKDYPLTRLSSTNASETAKVLENSYRATNIAFIEEWSKFAEEIGIDLFEVTDAIRVRPTHSNIRFPGFGVGGYCLTKDPMFAHASSSQIFGKKLDFPFSKLTVQVNHNMPLKVLPRLLSMIETKIQKSKILVCGVSYRQDIGDTRYSPSETLVRKLIDLKASVMCHDPYITYWEEMSMSLCSNLPNADEFDAVIFAVPHQQYKDLELIPWASGCKLIYDCNGIFSKNQRKLLRDNNVRVESVGRGDGL
jgi:UDP-N-acetyl-D-glucosamine dehydrogenase